jgi:hypothetical protein
MVSSNNFKMQSTANKKSRMKPKHSRINLILLTDSSMVSLMRTRDGKTMLFPTKMRRLL